MDKREALKIARRYIKLISQKYQIENAILFGSFAKGTNNIDSDIDLAIILNSFENRFDIQVDLMKMRNDNDLLIEPHPFSKEDFDISDPLVAEIIKNGIEIKNCTA